MPPPSRIALPPRNGRSILFPTFGFMQPSTAASGTDYSKAAEPWRSATQLAWPGVGATEMTYEQRKESTRIQDDTEKPSKTTERLHSGAAYRATRQSSAVRLSMSSSSAKVSAHLPSSRSVRAQPSIA